MREHHQDMAAVLQIKAVTGGRRMRKQDRNLASIPISNHTRVTVEHTRLRELPQNPLAIRPEMVRHQHRSTVSFRHNGAQSLELCRMELGITAGAVLRVKRTISGL